VSAGGGGGSGSGSSDALPSAVRSLTRGPGVHVSATGSASNKPRPVAAG
jgi:hypothetical protein